MWRRYRFLLLTATLLGILGTQRPARAQDEAEPEAEEEIQAPRRRAFVISDQDFERLVYGSDGADQARKRIESDLAQEVHQIDQMYRLTPDQKKKLYLAGRGDIKRLFDRAEQAREMHHRANGNFNRIILREFRPLPSQVHLDLFGKESIFTKTLKTTLTSEQRAFHEQERLAYYRSRVDWMVPQIHHRLQFSDEQRRRFVDAIVEETRPLEKYGKYDFLALLFQVSRLPEAKLKPIFDEAQWRLLRHELNQVRRQEKFLAQQGYLPARQADVRRPTAVPDGSKPKAADDRNRLGVLLGAGRASRD